MSAPAQQPTRLHLVTAAPNTEPPCDGGYTCDCYPCQAERATLVLRGPRPEQDDQPWHARQAA